MNQDEKIKKYIETYGSISPLEAFRDLGITKLATVVSRMKREGIVFFQRLEFSRNRFGENVHYMRYWLDEKQYKKDMEELKK